MCDKTSKLTSLSNLLDANDGVVERIPLTDGTNRNEKVSSLDLDIDICTYV